MTDSQITWDQDAEAIYVRFSGEEVAGTVALSNSIYIDFDQLGNPVGMEVLHVDAGLLAALKNMPDTATLRDLIRTAA